MRAKQVLGHFHLRARAKLVWSRITLSRLTTVYFAVAAIHCIVQIILQIQAFAVNADAANSLWSLLVEANETREAQGFAVLTTDLRICYKVPKVLEATTNVCSVIWSPAGNLIAVPTAVADRVYQSTGIISSVAATPAVTPQAVVVSSPIAQPSPAVVTPLPATTAAATTVRKIVTKTVVLAPTQAVQQTISNKNNIEGDDADDFSSLANALTKAEKSKRSLTVSKNPATGDFDVNGLQVNGKAVSTTITQNCVQTLIYPLQRLNNTKREDITLILFQVWVLSMSLIAVLNESIPHLSAAVFTQLVVFVWTTTQIIQTEDFRQDFFRLTVNGACRPNNLLGDYWKSRKDAEIASATLNGVGLFVTAFLTYKLLKVYSWQTYKRIGASLTINRIYKLVLSLSMTIQLALFFIVAAAGLWVDQLYHGSVAHLSSHRKIYEGGVIAVICLLPPWLALGWFAIRREMRKSSLVFLALNIGFVAVWAVQFQSLTFRWTFKLWTFFSLMVVVAGFLLLSTLALGLACRLNFGKGLPNYLNFQEPIEGVDFAPVYPDGENPDMVDFKNPYDDIEKIDFPSSGGRNLSVNFSAQQGQQGIDSAYPNAGGLRSPERAMPATHIRDGSISTLNSQLGPQVGHSLVRTNTQESHSSQNSFGSTSSRPTVMAKRWVIE